MKSVAIRFIGGQLDVKDERGRAVDTARVILYLVRGNDCPVALIQASGIEWSAPVRSLEVDEADAVVATSELLDEIQPEKE